MCGSDGATYNNLCELAAASVLLNTKLTVKHKGVCKKGKRRGFYFGQVASPLYLTISIFQKGKKTRY